MSILVTGGHGHIGSWTAYYLAQAGEHILLYDTNPVAPDCLREVAEAITFVQGDVLDFPRLVDVVTRQREAIHAILHTVSILGEMVQVNPYHGVTVNISGTHNVLEIARLFAIPRVVYTSSGAVYPPVTGVVAEDDYTPRPSDLYGVTKLSCEYLGQQYAAAFGFEFRIGRVYFCYGPGKHPSQLVPLHRMIFGGLEGLPELVAERGADQKFDFTYIEDAARGLALLCQASSLQHSVFNIATGLPTRVSDVVALVQRVSAFDVPVEFGPGVLMQRAEALDITRARHELGYEPRYDLEEGVQRYADWLGKTARVTQQYLPGSL